MVIGKGNVLVGISERTTPQGIENLAKQLFRTHQAKQVIAIKLPEDRSCMHLDTVMTHMDHNVFFLFTQESLIKIWGAGQSPLVESSI